MSSPLSGVAITDRRRLATVLGVFGILWLAITVILATGSSVATHVLCALAAVIAVVTLLVAWGVRRSIRIDEADASLDAAITEAIAASPAAGQLCDCGHTHDPDELHITDACEHDGTGEACSHDCQTCVLTTLRRTSN